MTAPVRAVGVRFEAQGVPEVQAATRAVQRSATEASDRVRASTRAGLEGAAESAQRKWSIAGRQIATSMADIGRTGELAGGGLKKIAIVGGEMAVMFSPIGPIASAIALLTLGIVSMFKRARDEQAETQKQFLRGLSEMGAAADFNSIQAQAGKLWKGTLNPTTMQFEGGAGEWSRKESALRQRGANPFDLGAPGALKNFYSQKVISPLDGKEITVQQLLTQYQQTITMMQSPLNAPRGPRSPITIGASTGADKKASQAAYERAMLNNGYGFSGKIAPTMLTDADKAMFAKLEGATPSSPILSSLLPSQEQLDKEMKETIAQVGYWVTDHIDAIKSQFATVGQVIAETISQSLSDGLRAAFETLFSGGGITNSFKALGKVIQQQLGALFADLAMKALGLAKLFAAFQKALASMNPWAAMAIAGALLVAANALGGSAKQFNYGSSAASSSVSSVASNASGESVTRLLWGENSTTLAAGMTPRQAMNITIIGPNDPTAQRAIQELIKKSDRRS
ncbi:MAG: hypothetical protein WC700_02140 [Gemmatimonadaceae bacterium]|jgi:hypothetical protein